MTVQTPIESNEIRPTSLPDETFLSIGRIVRACADIEDIIDLFISSLADTTELATSIMLQHVSVSKRMDIAVDLAKIREDYAFDFCRIAFNGGLHQLFECRDTIAYGKLLGQTERGYAFLVPARAATNDKSDIREVKHYSAGHLVKIAHYAGKKANELEAFLKVSDLRAERAKQPIPRLPRRG